MIKFDIKMIKSKFLVYSLIVFSYLFTKGFEITIEISQIYNKVCHLSQSYAFTKMKHDTIIEIN